MPKTPPELPAGASTNRFRSRADANYWFDNHLDRGGVYQPSLGCLVAREGNTYVRVDGSSFELGEDLWFLDGTGAPVVQFGSTVISIDCRVPIDPQPQPGNNGGSGGTPAQTNYAPLLVLALLLWWSRKR